MRSLVVEDEFICRKILQKILSPYGECHMAVDGEEAVKAFKIALEENNPYDLICMDIMMPKMSGQEALKKIREIEKEMSIKGSKEVKVIMATALGDPKTVFESFYQGGATSYIVKPVTKKNLEEKLRDIELIQ